MTQVMPSLSFLLEHWFSEDHPWAIYIDIALEAVRHANPQAPPNPT